jgi:gamma-glutamyl-gamma-aminobutyrate hydrolase PuuD
MAEKPAPGRRPLIVIPARFSPGATALRYTAEVTARALVEAVFAAGGEPVAVHPYAPSLEIDVDSARERVWFADGVLLPGGGDVAAGWSDKQPHPTEYGVDEEQDAFDIAVARVALADRLPLLAICRGNQIVNVSLGGDLVQDMDDRWAIIGIAFMILMSMSRHRLARSLAGARQSRATTTNALPRSGRGSLRRRTHLMG